MANKFFEVSGGIKFPDGSTLSTAPGGGGYATTSTLNNGEYALALGTDGTVNLPQTTSAGNAIIQTPYNVQVIANTKTWVFGTDGSLAVPGTINAAGAVGVDINWTSDTGGGPGDLHYDALRINNDHLHGLYITNTMDGTSRSWLFAKDGMLTFPDNTKQSTAWTSTIFNYVGTDIVPTADVAYDLGSPEKRWRSLYISANTIFVGTTTISVNTSGSLAVGGKVYVSNIAPVGAGLSASLNTTTGIVTMTNTGVTSVVGSTYIGVSTSTGAVTFTNLGVTTAAGTQYLGVSTSTGDLVFTNLGVQQAVGTQYLGVSRSTGTVTFTNLGVQTISGSTFLGVSTSTGSVSLTNLGVTNLAGSLYIAVSANTGSITISNMGVLSVAGTTYLGVSAATGTVTFTNLGVQTISGGTGINASASTGSVTLTLNTLTLMTNAVNAVAAVSAGNVLGGSAGALHVQIAPGVTDFVSLGAAGYVLQSNGSTAVWVSTSSLGISGGAGGGGGSVPGGTTGSIVIQSAPSVSSFIAIGGTGTVLQSNGSTAVWVSTSSLGISGGAGSFNTATLVTQAVNIAGGSAGGLPYQTAAGATAILPIGSNAFVLTSNGLAPTWQALAGVSSGSATTATNVAGGSAGQIPYQIGTGNTSFFGPGTLGQILVSRGTTSPIYTNTSSIFVGLATTATSLTNTGSVYVGYAATATSLVNGTYTAFLSATGGFTVPNIISNGSGIGVVTITAQTGTTTSTWIFNGTGSLQFPDGSTQLTAYNTNTTTNLALGLPGSIPYQVAANQTNFIGIGAAGTVLTSNGSSATWIAPSTGLGTGTIIISNTSQSVSTTTGALQVAGGVGVAGNIFFNGNLYQNGVLFTNVSTSTTATFTILNTTGSLSTATGALQVKGGVGIAQNLWVGGTFNSVGPIYTNGAAVSTYTTGTLVAQAAYAQTSSWATSSTSLAQGTWTVSVGTTGSVVIPSVITSYINSGSVMITASSGTQVAQWIFNGNGNLYWPNGTQSSSAFSPTLSTILTLTNTTLATSAGVGALQMLGGAYIAGNMYIGSTATIASSSSNDPTLKLDVGSNVFSGIGFTKNGITSATIRVASGELYIDTNGRNIWFQTSGLAAYQNDLYLWHRNELMITSTWAGPQSIAGRINLASSGTQSTSIYNGTLQVRGGVGIDGNLFVSTATVNNNMFVAGNSSINGSLKVDKGAVVQGGVFSQSTASTVSAVYNNTVYGITFPGSGAKLQISNANLDFSTGDFTIEFWGMLTTIGTYNSAINFSGTGQTVLRIGADGWNSILGSIAPATKATPLANQWFHYALSRKAGTAYIHINGVQYLSAPYSTGLSLNTGLIGTYAFSSGQDWVGAISNLRVTKSAVVYQPGSTFTPETSLGTGTNVLLLTGTGPTIVDVTGNTTLTPTGMTLSSTGVYSFSTTATYSASNVFAGSLSVGGNVDFGGTMNVAGIASVHALIETSTIVTAAPSATTNFDVLSQGVCYYTSATTSNFTLNIRGNTSTTLNSVMSVGQSVTVGLLVTNGATAFTATTIQVDGSAITPKWQGGITPTTNPNSIDVYSMTAIKTGNAAFTLLASVSKFA